MQAEKSASLALGVGATPTAARAALTMSGEAAITARGRAVALWC